MNKIFGFYSKLSKSDQRKLYKMYCNSKLNPDSIHNLVKDLIIPPSVRIILNLGLKFSVNLKPDFSSISKALKEGMRKISWKLYFMDLEQDKVMDKPTQILHRIKKCNQIVRRNCPIEKVLFNDNFVQNIISNLKRSSHNENPIHKFLINELKTFTKHNNVIIKDSDKNAGICIMSKVDYDNEVYRQLNDLETYIPSNTSEFDLKMYDFVDKARHLSNNVLKHLKIRSLIPPTFNPAKFHILPKVHKKFDHFPLGRPISSTIGCGNRGIAMLSDSILQPVSLLIPDLIIDTPHLLFLLDNLKLDKNRKYILVTADISSMYLELPISICKRNCLEFFNKFPYKSKLPFAINHKQLQQLLNLTLDYSFVQYQDQLYFQKKGIQMGNCASVPIANITAAVELEKLWRDEIVFKGRFIDDILSIIDVTGIEIEIQEWLNQMFQHDFLKFTYEYSGNSVNFLDLTIELDHDNNIHTKIYKKPMSKHEFVHYNSNHPRHLLNSLPYSSGLRIVRSCSDPQTRIEELHSLLNKFRRRDYPDELLSHTLHKLLNMDRNEILRPKSPLHILHTSYHRPDLIPKLNIGVNPNANNYTNTTFIVLPFHSNITKMGRHTKECFNIELNKCNSNRLRQCIEDLNVKIAFSIPNSLNRFINVYNKQPV